VAVKKLVLTQTYESYGDVELMANFWCQWLVYITCIRRAVTSWWS